MTEEVCFLCARDLCTECSECDCCNPVKLALAKENNDGKISNSSGRDTSGSESPSVRFGESLVGRRTKSRKDDELVRDAKSTGRKRAAVDYPLNSDEPCEWRGLANAGGGQFAIIGCLDGRQQNRHHGPDKNTLNNSEGNVHRICAGCHNIWHTRNDPCYRPDLGHKPRIATNEELLDRQLGVRYCVSDPKP